MTSKSRTIAALLALTLAIAPAGATQTQFFKVATRDDFKAGKMEGVVATNFGELRLARAVDSVLKDDGAYASIDALAEGTDGTIYVGTTASGKLLAIKDDKSTELMDFGEGASVSAIAVDAGGDVVIGVSGERAQLFGLRRGAAKPELLVTLDDAESIWAIAITPDGTALVGTGPNGKLFSVDRKTNAATVLFDSDEDNIRCVAINNDAIFIGTDPNGLILKVDRKTGKAFVVYDAPETEVSALLVDTRNGQLYAATSQLVEAPAGDQKPQQAAESDDKSGRPGGGANDELPAGKPPETPKPPKGEPRPGELTRAMDAAIRSMAAAAPEPPAKEPPASQPANGPAKEANSPAGPKPMTPATEADAEVAADGNAVYRIDSQGFVSEVFREPAMIFALARRDDELLVATGPSGTLYQVDLASEEHAAIAQTRSQQLTSLLLASDGRAWIGSSDSAELSRLSASVAKTGSFTTDVLDATQIAAFGKLQVRGAVPDGTTMTVSARSSNVSDADSQLWSEWTAPVAASRFASVPTPAARYAQVKVTLTGDGKTLTPTLDSLELAYLRPNVAPRIDAVTVTTPAAEVEGDDPVAQPSRTIAWTATDANGDAMRFDVCIRTADQPWITIAKDLAEPTYTWDTRRVADGRYEVKVVASDALANAVGTGKTASRIADAIVVDNAPPTIGDVAVKRVNGKVEVDLHVVDKGGIVSKVEYRLDDATHWQTAASSDTLDDSPDERYAIVLPDPGATTRVLSLRGRDENGNAAYESVTIRPEK